MSPVEAVSLNSLLPHSSSLLGIVNTGEGSDTPIETIHSSETSSVGSAQDLSAEVINTNKVVN